MELWNQLSDDISNLLDASTNTGAWAKSELNVSLYSYQQEIVDSVVDLNCRYLVLVACRGIGKTFGVATGLVRLAILHPGIQIGIFGPKLEQAARILSEIKTKVLSKNSKLHKEVDWQKTTQSRMYFRNGSEMQCLSAFETTMTEGWHFDVCVGDECHRISNLSFERTILPMIGSSPIAKIIKLGVALYKNHFYHSFMSPQYKKLTWDWTQAEILLKSGAVEINGKLYSKYVLDRMPLSLKMKIFPDCPKVHYEGDMNEIDFKTQYMVEWLDDISSALSEEDQRKLIGEHVWLESGIVGEEYFFGLDTASGTISRDKTSLDYTALAVWRKKPNGIKEKVHCFETQSSALDQMAEIYEIIHPKTGRFKCKFGLVDYSNVGIVVVEAFKREGIPVEGIIFASTDRSSGKNYKNAMFNEFLFELKSGRAKFPNSVEIDRRYVLRKSLNELCVLERYRTASINDRIEAPSELYHDDHAMSDFLAVYAADKGEMFGNVIISDLPKAIFGVNSAIFRQSQPTPFVSNKYGRRN